MPRKFHLYRAWLALCLAGLLFLTSDSSGVKAQISDLLSMDVTAGYDGLYRPNQWTPLRVQINNQDIPVTGRLVVRPETSGSALTGTFSTSVDLPANSNQSIFLYVTLREGANMLRVELLNDDGIVINSREVSLRDLLSRDSLHVVVSSSLSGALNLDTVHVGAYNAYQTLWTIEDVPDRFPALDSVNTMIFTDVDTGALSTAQQRAISRWLVDGGHLIVTGGANWQATAAGLADLLPLNPTSTRTVSNLSALGHFAGRYRTTLAGDAVITTGTLAPGAHILAATDDNTPLILRHQVGGGTVDYLAFDPASQSLRGWDEIPEMWFNIFSGLPPRPGWSFGFFDWSDATDAVEILPGYDALPASLELIGFLALYIVLIGPVNYWILSRINRREYAWVTIPLLIIVFSVIAWTVGFQLRGSHATFSRLSVVQTWPDVDEAQIDQVLGLLAPRRADYSLSVDDNLMLRPISAALSTPGTSTARFQGNVNIQQSSRFEAVNFPVDASFISSFNTKGTTVRPEINGRAVITYDNEGAISVRGSVRNDSNLTLEDAVLLTRDGVIALTRDLSPGDVYTFGEAYLYPAARRLVASPLEYARGDPDALLPRSFTFRRRTSISALESTRTIRDIIGEDNYQSGHLSTSFRDDPAIQELHRRQLFLAAFMMDQFASTGRDNRIYLVGWNNESPLNETVTGVDTEVLDTTVYIIMLDVEVEQATQRAIIQPDQIVWISRERENVDDLGPTDLVLDADVSLTFQLTPLPGSQLAEVEELVIIVERAVTMGVAGAVALWDWQAEEWVAINIGTTSRYAITEPAPYIGPQNSVMVRTAQTAAGSSIVIRQLAIEQHGTY